ncbi:hypothetical protein OF83DRAFT_1132613 [Amylostereum chailletii]|nr:hypothetical protein OF83DRAFT_1132613 [Amylostereum chailletii]
MPTHLLQQGRGDLIAPAPQDLGELIRFRDPDKALSVYLCVHPAEGFAINLTQRDLHWSIGWHIMDEIQPGPQPMLRQVWRQIHVVTHNRDYDPPPQPRLVFWGTITSIVGQRTTNAEHLELGIMTLQTRSQIEALALQVPVMAPDGTWNCQDFLKDLLQKMVEAGIIDKDKKDSVIEMAEEISP